jgi:hypothetical protein
VVKLEKTKKGRLSEARRHCSCQKEYNPDQTMFKCTDKNCGIWNYEECLVGNVLDRVYCKSLTGQLHGDREGRTKEVNEEMLVKS